MAELAEDVVVDGDVLLPAGSEVIGHVVSAVRSGRVKGKARLVVSFDQVRADGKTFRIDATGFDVTAGSSAGKDAKIAGGAAAAGAVIGAIADGGEGALKGGLIGGAAGRRGRARDPRQGGRAPGRLALQDRAQEEPAAELRRSSSRRSAQAACSRTTGSSSPASRSSSGRWPAVARVAERHRHVAQQPPPLRALHRAAPEALAEGLFVEAGEPGEVGRLRARPRLEGGAAAVAPLPVPRAHVLADVAAEDVAAHALARAPPGSRPSPRSSGS